MKQITKTLGFALMLVSMPVGKIGFANNEPPTSRLRYWSEIHASKKVVRTVTTTNHSSVVRELPAVPGYAVQVGAFSDFNNAENFILSLRRKGIGYIYFKKRWVNGKPFYKVVVGPFRERKNAAGWRDEIKRNYGVNDGFVVTL